MSKYHKEVIGNATLYLGDCRDVLPTLQKVDALVTDPPYGEKVHKPCFRTRNSLATGIREGVSFPPIDINTMDIVCKEIPKICEGWFLCFSQVENMHLWLEHIKNNSGKYKRSIAWVKPDAAPQITGDRPAQGFELILSSWFGSGHSKWNAGGKRGIYTHLATHGRESSHPTEKPVSLMKELVNDFVSESGVVLDPFMGSGTTGVACMNLGRAFIGVEINKEYFEIACERIENAQRQERLFA